MEHNLFYHHSFLFSFYLCHIHALCLLYHVYCMPVCSFTLHSVVFRSAVHFWIQPLTSYTWGLQLTRACTLQRSGWGMFLVGWSSHQGRLSRRCTETGLYTAYGPVWCDRVPEMVYIGPQSHRGSPVVIGRQTCSCASLIHIRTFILVYWTTF